MVWKEKLAKRMLVGMLLAWGLGAGVSGVAQVREELSLDAMMKEARRLREEMQKNQIDAVSRLREAREEGPVHVLDCVNEGLTAMKGVVRLGDDYLVGMEADAAKKNIQAVREALGKLRIAGRKVDELAARVQACGGPGTAGIVEGRPAIERVGEPDLPEVDVLESLDAEALLIDRPTAISPYH